MIYNCMSSILRHLEDRNHRPLNILTAPTHERYETGLCLTGHNFYSFGWEGFKTWNEQYGQVPSNYCILDSSKKEQQIPTEVSFDLVLSQNKFGQFQVLSQLARQLQVPLVSLEHTLPVINWPEHVVKQCSQMRGYSNVFISEYSINQWGFSLQDNSVKVVHHMVDEDLFLNKNKQRNNHILSVVNDWINRDWCCNFQGWKRITIDNKLPVKVVGDTAGLSKPAKSIDELVEIYNTSRIFLNTSTVSPIPTALLEAMSCGCAVVSTATCMIPEIIQHGYNGFISNDEKELYQYCIMLLQNKDKAYEIGQNAAKTIKEKFNKQQFIDGWNKILYTTANMTYIG